jgi:hypothetical protein
MAEGEEQSFGSILDPTERRVHSAEGVGLKRPRRDLAHAQPGWFETDADDPVEDPDEPALNPLPDERHRKVP